MVPGEGTANVAPQELMTPQQDEMSLPVNRTVSVRKVEANRRNALKSTGPRTPRGKAYTRQNAVKHGLFFREWDSSDEQEQENYHKRLFEDLQPVGPREEFEVEQIAICCLRLQRLWSYENAELEAGKMSAARNLEVGFRHGWADRATQMSLLRTAEKEAEVKGQISQELMESIFVESSSLRSLWPYFEADAEKTAQKKRPDIAMRIAEERKIPLSESKALLARDPKALPERERFVAVETVREAIRHLSDECGKLYEFQLQNEYQRQLLPIECKVNKIIRYGSAFERQLSRANDRLERLQRCRKGEFVPLPVNVRFTR